MFIAAGAASGIPMQGRSARDAPNWPTYHLLNAVSLPNATAPGTADCTTGPSGETVGRSGTSSGAAPS